MFKPNTLLLSFLLTALPIQAQTEQISVAVVGDADRMALVQNALVMPFTKATGIAVKLTAIAPQDAADEAVLLSKAVDAKWDFVTLSKTQALQACDAGVIEQIDVTLAKTGNFLTTTSKPLSCQSFNELRIDTMVYMLDAYRGENPNHISAFFDPELYPGKRVVAGEITGLFELALMGYGVPASQVYHLLSTARGIKLAGDIVAPIKDELLIAKSTAEATGMMRDGEAAMGLLEIAAALAFQTTIDSSKGQTLALSELSPDSSFGFQTSWIKTAAGDASDDKLVEFIEFAEQSNFTNADITTGINKDAEWYYRASSNIKNSLEASRKTLTQKRY